ncbi:MAG: hypothetical protein OSB62_05580 [Alphaproteobacteria bacterium]|nr:hypothetical protein [Alphaproteobacteria bacterium]
MSNAQNQTKPSSAERLESALQALEGYVRTGGNMTAQSSINTAEIQVLNKDELEALRTENAILKDKHNNLKLRLDKTIGHIETILEKS